jgi:heme exporter protein B
MRPGTARAALVACLKRDLLLLWRQRSDTLNPLLFALMVATLFPFAVGPEFKTLARIAGGVVWVTVLLASLLTLETLFRTDVEDGSIDQLLSSGQPLTVATGSKILVHWLGTGLPLVLLAPLLALMLGLPGDSVPTLIAALALGTPLLSMIGACCAALTVGMRRSGILLALLVLPLTVPVLIFGAGAIDAAGAGLPATVPLLLLGAGLAISGPLAPLVCATALRIGSQ